MDAHRKKSRGFPLSKIWQLTVITLQAHSRSIPVDDDWEEYDASKGPFAVHMIAGSCAGLAEHFIVYPIDTMKTYLQVRYDNNAHKNLAGRSALKNVIATQGMTRCIAEYLLFAGVTCSLSFFSVYEISKEKFGQIFKATILLPQPHL